MKLNHDDILYDLNQRPETPPYYTTHTPGIPKKLSSDIDPNAISKRFSKAFITELLVISTLFAELVCIGEGCFCVDWRLLLEFGIGTC